MRHFNMFTLAFVLISFVVSGCFSSHGRPDFVVPMEDSGPFVGGDAGPTEPDSGRAELDSGPVVMADASSDAGPVIEPDAGTVDAGPLPVELVVDPFFSGWDTPVGQQDMPTNDIRATATHDLDWEGGIVFRIEANDPGCMVRGSLGTEYFRDIKLKNTETGETWFGPTSMPPIADGAASTGSFRFGTGGSRRIMAGTTLRFSITMDLSTVEDASGEFVGCGYNVYTGMEGGSIIEASSIRLTGGAVLLPEQIGGDNTAAYSGFHVLSPLIEAGVMRPSEIVVAGTPWFSTASYEVVRSRIRSVFVMIDGFAEDTSAVAIASHGAIIGRGSLPPGENSGTIILLDTPVEAGDAFDVWVQVPLIPTDPSVRPRSGDSFRMGVNGYSTGGTFFVTEPLFGNEFVIRRSVPTLLPGRREGVRIVPEVRQDIIRLDTVADPAGCIGIKRFGIAAGFTRQPGSTLNIGYLGLRRGTTEVPIGDYLIQDDIGRDVRGSALDTFRFTTAASLFVTFANEDTVCGSGESLSVHAIILGTVMPGDRLSVSLAGSFPTGPVTGHLTRNDAVVSGTVGTHLDVGVGSASEMVFAPFVWSDLSAVPHSAQSRDMGGSRDWTDSQLVPGFGMWTSPVWLLEY